MKAVTTVCAGLSALVLGVFALTFLVPGMNGHLLAWIALGTAGIAGTVTTTYKFPVSSTTTAPTGAQASATQLVVAEVNWADSDTTAPITHDFGVGTTGPSPNTSQYLPEVIITPVSLGTAGLPSLTVVWTSGNVVTIGKGSTAGTGGTFVVYVRRPHSIGL
jgi:hypothetical protein